MMPPCACASTPERFTTIPQSSAQVTLCTRTVRRAAGPVAFPSSTTVPRPAQQDGAERVVGGKASHASFRRMPTQAAAIGGQPEYRSHAIRVVGRSVHHREYGDRARAVQAQAEIHRVAPGQLRNLVEQCLDGEAVRHVGGGPPRASGDAGPRLGESKPDVRDVPWHEIEVEVGPRSSETPATMP